MLDDIKDTIILGLKMATVGFVMAIVAVFAFISAVLLIIKYRNVIRCIYKGACSTTEWI